MGSYHYSLIAGLIIKTGCGAVGDSANCTSEPKLQ